MNPRQLWDTTMDPEKRRLLQIRIEDVVDAVLYLASERSAYVTGQALNVSGGREMH